MCKVVNLRKEKYTVYCGRPGKGITYAPFGNHFIVGVHGERGECRQLFKEFLLSNNPDAINLLQLIKDTIKKDDILGCFCGAGKCHADFIAAYVNSDFDIDSIKKEP
jgi:hypothetical protein